MQLCLEHARGRAFCDVGIGGGAFVLELLYEEPDVRGFDVNEHAKRWLEERSLWRNPHRESCEVLTFWDSFEHIREPGALIDGSGPELVIMSMPIYEDRDDCIASKHFKPGEHLWYFTERGLLKWMRERGFGLRYSGAPESCWREGIRNYVFQLM